MADTLLGGLMASGCWFAKGIVTGKYATEGVRGRQRLPCVSQVGEHGLRDSCMYGRLIAGWLDGFSLVCQGNCDRQICNELTEGVRGRQRLPRVSRLGVLGPRMTRPPTGKQALRQVLEASTESTGRVFHKTMANIVADERQLKVQTTGRSTSKRESYRANRCKVTSKATAFCTGLILTAKKYERRGHTNSAGDKS